MCKKELNIKNYKSFAVIVFLAVSSIIHSQQDLEKNTLSSTVKIMPLGNSITFDSRSNDNRNIGEKAGYRSILYNLLLNAGFNFDFIGSEHSGGNFLPAGYDEHAGFPGISDDELLYLMKTGHLFQPSQGIDRQVTGGAYLNSYNPDVVLLHIGTNGNDGIDGTNPFEVEQILDEIDVYENNSGKEVIVLLARIIDRVPNQLYVSEFNNNVESMALDRVLNPLNDAYPDKIYIVDMQNSAGFNYSISPDPNGSPGDMNDALHPNSGGYEKMAFQWYETLLQVLPNPPKIIKQPSDQYTVEGESAKFVVSIESNENVLFQWRKNNANIPLATDSILSLSNTLLSDNGSEYSCKITNANGTVYTVQAKLFVNNSNIKVANGILVEYDFEEGEGSTIQNKISSSEDLALNIYSQNAVQWIDHGIKIKTNANISTSLPVTLLSDSINSTNQFSIELWFATSELSQAGPARILTISGNNEERNLTLGQSSNNFVMRTRTTETDLNGIPEFVSENAIEENLLTHVVFTRDEAGVQKIYINGNLFSTNQIVGNLSNWNSGYKLAIGNEFGSNQPWIGNLYYMAIYKRNLSSVEVNHNYSFGEYGITSTRKINNFNETEFQLYQNYPNPFNPSTSISFNVPELSYVSLYIYNSLGQQVYRLQDKQYSTGTYSYEFDGSSLSSGIYYYSIKATSNKGKKFINTKKMLLIK